MSRRSLIRNGGLALLGAAAAGSLNPGVAVAQTTPPPAPAGARLVGVPADAAAVQQWFGHRIKTLFPYKGRIFYGYGNYGSNSGYQSGLGTNVSAYNPDLDTFEVLLQGYNTEEINTFRQLSAGLHTPAIDWFTRQASFASDRDGVWAAAPKVGAVHVYDVAEGIDGEIFVCGSGGGGGRIWRSPDGGATWESFFTEPADEGFMDGMERVYWMARVGDTLYWKTDPGNTYSKRPPMRSFDLVARTFGVVKENGILAGWSTSDYWVNGVLTPGYKVTIGDRVYEANAVISAGDRAYFHGFGRCWAFDGRKAVLINENTTGISRDEHGTLYLSTSAGVHQLTGNSLTLVDPTPVGRHFAILDRRLYFVRGDNELWVKTLADTPAPAPEPGKPGKGNNKPPKPPKEDNPNKGKGNNGNGGNDGVPT